jgi:pyruvate kinase
MHCATCCTPYTFLVLTLTIGSRVQTARAVANFPMLAVLADGVVLARGCLGLHVAADKAAVLQKRLIRACNLLGKLCIVARILDTMVAAPRPTRAEATDIANSVIDGADGFLLGAQTTRGANPRECVRTTLGICREAEKHFDFGGHYDRAVGMLREARRSPACLADLCT